MTKTKSPRRSVALFTRAWIEIVCDASAVPLVEVALFTRAWIEIDVDSVELDENGSRPLHEGVD